MTKAKTNRHLLPIKTKLQTFPSSSKTVWKTSQKIKSLLTSPKHNMMSYKWPLKNSVG